MGAEGRGLRVDSGVSAGHMDRVWLLEKTEGQGLRTDWGLWAGSWSPWRP